MKSVILSAFILGTSVNTYASDIDLSKNFEHKYEIELSKTELSNVTHFSLSLCDRTSKQPCVKLGKKKYYTVDELKELQEEEKNDPILSGIGAVAIGVPSGFVLGALAGVPGGPVGAFLGAIAGSVSAPIGLGTTFERYNPNEQARQNKNLNMVLTMIDNDQNIIQGKDVAIVANRINKLLLKIDYKVED